MKVALCQLNPVVGDIEGNVARLEETLAGLRTEGPDLAVFPELYVTGYPPLDLLSYEWFVDAAEKGVERVRRVSERYPETGVLVGAVVRHSAETGHGLHNAALLFLAGKELLRQPKTLLPTYDVFDEQRYFDPAPTVKKVRFRDRLLGVSVCEDAWNSPGMPGPRRYDRDPVADLAKAGADLLLNIAASPFSAGKEALRLELLRGHVERYKVPFVFVNQVGANDELVFDGRSLVLDRNGEPVSVLPGFEEAVRVVDADGAASGDGYEPESRVSSMYRALVLGVRDYARKCGFEKVVIGLSGGIDSAVTCAIAADALGPGKVLGVVMPSKFSSEGSIADSKALADNLGVGLEKVPITALFNSYRRALKEQLAGREPDVTEENIQARVRGNILMAISNRAGRLVLATGNKSEMAVGYCTLYGDMSGGLAVLSDVPKTTVYELARYVNRERERIPRSTMEKPPSAELRPGQKDEDSLPEYETLDAILERYIERGWSEKRIAAEGYDAKTVAWVAEAVRRNEYKRRQAAMGLKVTSRAFGIGRRMPVAARYGSG